jgi:hypothetical protein
MLLVLGAAPWVAANASSQGNRPITLGGASASDSTTVALSPATLTLLEGQSATVQVWVYDVVDLGGFDIRLRFDPSVVRVLDAEHDGVNVLLGDLTEHFFPVLNGCDNAVGTIAVAAAQTGNNPVSGDGVLFSMQFQAIAVGDAALRFESVDLADPSGIMMGRELNTQVFTVVDSTPTPTATATAQPSATPSVSATLSPTPSVTPTTSPTPYFYFEPQILEVGPGGTGQMDIRTSWVDGLGGVEVHVRWNPACLQVVDADPLLPGTQILPGDLFTGHNTYQPINGHVVDDVAGELTYALALVAPQSLAGQWTVARITWQALGAGVCPVEFFGNTKMAASETGDVPSAWIDGEVRIVPPTPTPTLVPTLPTPTPTVAPTVVVCENVVQNGGFETLESGNPVGWGMLQSAAVTTQFAHAGEHSVWLGGYNNATDGITTTVTIPADALSATLSYWRYMETWETDHSHDYLHASLHTLDGDLIALLLAHHDGDPSSTWLSATVNLLPYAGQTMQLRFRIQNNETNFTNFFIDDVSLNVCIEQPQQGASHVWLPLMLKSFAKMPGF